MKLGVMAALFNGRDFEQTLAYCAESGLDAIELPVGGYPGAGLIDPAKALSSKRERDRINGLLSEYGLICSGLAVHGNPVHPAKRQAKSDHEAFVRAVKLAPMLGTDIVVTFSGCPGGSATDKQPNWVTCPWPPEYADILEYQWEKVLVPYWSTQAKLCRKHGVRVAWEAHPGFCVYNPDTLIRLSETASKAAGRGKCVLGANLDPSHLFWQGIDPVLAARTLGEAGLLFYCHAKDTELDPHEGPVNGYLDGRPYGDLKNRSWSFRTCGHGHGHEFWKPFISMLRRYGYDHVLSIEHEDAYMSVEEGLQRAIEFLNEAIIFEEAATPWWT